MNNDTQEFSTEAHELISFRDDVAPQVLDPPNKQSHWYDFTSVEQRESDIKTVLARPRVLYSGSVTSTTTFSQAYSLPNLWINTGSNLKTKLANYTFLKGTFVARFMVNATPFQCGKYWMYYVPYSAEGGKYPYTEDIGHITGYPGVELDIASSKSVELRIPLVGPFNAINLISQEGKFGDLFIRELIQIRDGTSAASAGVSVFGWIEDAELFLPSAKALVYAQSKDEAATAASKGVVSGFADKVGSLANSLGKAMPELAGYTAPLSWAAGITSGVASYFGFSKPMDISTSTAVYSVPAKGFTNTTGVDYGVVLGALPDNSVGTEPGPTGASVDEMSLSYVCGRPCIYDAITWNTSQVTGTRLRTIAYRPFDTSIVNSNKCPTLLQYASSMFNYWSGSITYRISFAKTAFHTGRLVISYIPDNAVAGEIYVPDTYRMVLDLSTTSEVTFTIPYVSNRPWRTVSPVDAPGAFAVEVLNPLNVSSESAASNITALIWHWAGPDFRLAQPGRNYAAKAWPEVPTEVNYVLPLRAQIMNETDTQVHQGAESTKLMPYSYTDPVESCKASMGETVVSLRSLTKRFTELARVYLPMVFNEAEGYGYYLFPPVKETPIGITVQSYYFGTETGSLSLAGRKDNTEDVDDPTNPAVYMRRFMSNLSMISQIYRFARGSVRFKYIMSQPTSQAGFTSTMPRIAAILRTTRTKADATALIVADAKDHYTAGHGLLNNFSHTISGDNGVLEFTVPQYITTPCTLATGGVNVNDYGLAYQSPAVDIIKLNDFNPSCAYNRIIPDTGEEINYLHTSLQWFPPDTLMVAAGDDFSFSFLGGAPPLVDVTP